MPTSIVEPHEHLPAALENEGGNLLRPAQMAEYEHDIKVAEDQLKNHLVQDKGAVRTRLRELRKNYDDQAPRPITDGTLKDRLWREAKQLIEDVKPGMLSQEEMRKNPPGAVDRHMKWERHNKKKLLRAKKILNLLNASDAPAGTWDRDAANLEKFRPVSAMDRLRTDAQIKGHMSYGSIADENWYEVFGQIEAQNSALNQAKRVQQSTASPEVASSDGKTTESKPKGK